MCIYAHIMCVLYCIVVICIYALTCVIYFRYNILFRLK